MVKQKLLFVISQFYKGGAETSLLNLFKKIDKSRYSVDFIIMNQYPVENAVSLVSESPTEIFTLDAWRENRAISAKNKIYEKLVFKKEDVKCDPVVALRFVREREYDWAFHVGEWWSPAFVALKVNSKRKAVWIHSDIAKASFFNPDSFFYYDCYFDDYIFVSQHSLKSSAEAFPFIRKKAHCIYNISDVETIKEKARESVKENYFAKNLPVIVTCANIRQEKNHRRQLEAMRILKQKGIDFLWLNIGSTADEERCKELTSVAKTYGLDDRFILTGPRDNPFPYIAQATAVAVLSNHESWSLVITEAKILGTPVIATKTSGALEQIEDGVSGVLANFSANDIANKIEDFLTNKSLRERIKKNIFNFDNTNQVLKEFYDFLEKRNENQKSQFKSGQKLLYVIDDINYLGGAHIATILQIQALLKRGYDISIFSTSLPLTKNLIALDGVHFLSWKDFPEDCLYNRRLLDCIFDRTLSSFEKKYKFRLSWEGRIKKNPFVFEKLVLPHLANVFSSYDTICVMSEASAFREVVAKSACPRKIQWVHIDYCEWRNKNSWTMEITKNDEDLYQHYNKIVLLSENIKDTFSELYPSLTGKLVVNPNLLPVETIKKKAGESDDKNLVHFVTVGRVDYQKGYDRLFDILESLIENGYRFYWTIVGDGEDYQQLSKRVLDSKLEPYVRMIGARSNPFPYVKKADVFALVSRYEGLPNTIYEAMILGTPVIATNVGGVSSQIEDNVNGWIVENTSEAIYAGIENILKHPEQIRRFKESLESYEYKNDEILKTAMCVLFGDEIEP